MLQTLFNHKITQKQGSVYGDLSVGNLKRTNLGRVSCISPQQEVINQISGSIEISVDSKPTGFTFQFSLSSDLINMTTPTASFRCSVRINSNNINLLLDSNNIQSISEFEIGDFINNPINFSTFRISKFSSSPQEFQIFNNNIGDIKLDSKFNNLVANLEHSCSNKIVFKTSNISQTSQSPIAESSVIDTFEFIFSNINLSSFMENILPKIELPQDFFIPVCDSQSETTSVYIDSNNTPIFSTYKFLFDTNLQNPFIFFNQSAGLKNPTIRSMAFKSMEQSVFSNRQNNPLAFNYSRESKERSLPFSLSIFKTSQIKINRDSPNLITDFSPIPNNPSCSDNQLSGEFVFQPKLLISGVM